MKTSLKHTTTWFLICALLTGSLAVNTFAGSEESPNGIEITEPKEPGVSETTSENAVAEVIFRYSVPNSGDTYSDAYENNRFDKAGAIIYKRKYYSSLKEAIIEATSLDFKDKLNEQAQRDFLSYCPSRVILLKNSIISEEITAGTTNKFIGDAGFEVMDPSTFILSLNGHNLQINKHGLISGNMILAYSSEGQLSIYEGTVSGISTYTKEPITISNNAIVNSLNIKTGNIHISNGIINHLHASNIDYFCPQAATDWCGQTAYSAQPDRHNDWCQNSGYLQLWVSSDSLIKDIKIFTYSKDDPDNENTNIRLTGGYYMENPENLKIVPCGFHGDSSNNYYDYRDYLRNPSLNIPRDHDQSKYVRIPEGYIVEEYADQSDWVDPSYKWRIKAKSDDDNKNGYIPPPDHTEVIVPIIDDKTNTTDDDETDEPSVSNNGTNKEPEKASTEEDTPIVTISDNMPMYLSTETRGGYQMSYHHGIPFAGKSKLTAESFGDDFTVQKGDTCYTVTKIKVNKKKHTFQITELDGADKDTIKEIKKMTKGKNGLPYIQNPYYVKGSDVLSLKTKNDGTLNSIKISLNGKDYKLKRNEWFYDESKKIIYFFGDNLRGTRKVP